MTGTQWFPLFMVDVVVSQKPTYEKEMKGGDAQKMEAWCLISQSQL